MAVGARTPEELDTLLEDACVTRDSAALARLFETAGVFVAAGLPAARGRAEIGLLATRWWLRGHSHEDDPQQIVLARGLALVIVGEGSWCCGAAGTGRGGW